MKSRIQINNEEITIRPSSLDNFVGCAYQWALVFLNGERSIPNSRASIGTGVHSGVEQMWTDAILTQDKETINLSAAKDAAVESFEEDTGTGEVQYGEDETPNSCINEVIIGVETFFDDIMPFAEIPKAVEKRYSIDIDHGLVKRVSGTIDYITGNTIGDVKTSKRSIQPQSHDLQQSIYKMLAEANGETVDQNIIQGVVFTKKPYGEVKTLTPNIPKAKLIVNNLLDTLDVLMLDTVQPELLFRGNPKYYLCSPKYCRFYDTCIFVKGEAPEGKKKAQPKSIKL